MEQHESILEDIRTTEIEAPGWKKFVAAIIDFAIEIGIIVGFYFLMPRDILASLLDGKPFMKYIIAFFIIFGYRLVCIMGAGKTVGMTLCKIKYLNSKQEPLSTGEKLTAVAINRTGIRMYKS